MLGNEKEHGLYSLAVHDILEAAASPLPPVPPSAGKGRRRSGGRSAGASELFGSRVDERLRSKRNRRRDCTAEAFFTRVGRANEGGSQAPSAATAAAARGAFSILRDLRHENIRVAESACTNPRSRMRSRVCGSKA
jgi:hypothetical protein